MILSATGHRPKRLGGFSKAAHSRLIDFANRCILRYDTEVEGIVGCALGWDQAVAQALLDQGHILHCAIPFDGFDALWSPEQRKSLDILLGKALTVHTVCHDIKTEHLAIEALMKRNRYMVDISNVVLALFDGSRSGTQNCVKYAEAKHRKVDNVWDKWQRYCIKRPI